MINTKCFKSILVIIPLLLLGCGQPNYYYKSELPHQYKDRCPEFAEKMRLDNMFYHHCYNQEASLISKELENICRSCAEECGKMLGWNRFYNAALYRPGNTLTKDEVDHYLSMVNHCNVSEFTERFFHLFTDSKKIDKECRFNLLLYVISNNKVNENSEIFDKYQESELEFDTEANPERFYCFDRAINELHDTMLQCDDVAVSSLRNRYYNSLPKMADNEFIENYNEAYSEIANCFISKNYKYYSVSKLDDNQKRTCQEKILPLIKMYHPHVKIEETPKATRYITIKEPDVLWWYGKRKYEVHPNDTLKIIGIKTCRSGSGICWKVKNIETGEIGIVRAERMEERHEVYTKEE